MLAVTKLLLLKHVFVATKIILVEPPANDRLEAEEDTAARSGKYSRSIQTNVVLGGGKMSPA